MFGVFDIALGWAWHTGYRARKFWRMRREGALFAAVAVLAIGVTDVVRREHNPITQSALPAVTARPAQAARPAATASATPVAETHEAVETIAAIPMPPQPLRTVAAAESPAPVIAAEGSSKLFTDPISTGSIPVADTPRPKKKPARAAKPIAPN